MIWTNWDNFVVKSIIFFFFQATKVGPALFDKLIGE